MLRPSTGLWRLRAIKDRIGAVLDVSPSKYVWVELDLNGEMIGQWTYTGSMTEWFDPTALTSTGTLYGIRSIDRKRAGIAVFDKTTGTWKPLSRSPKGHLIGAEGDQLVFQSGDDLVWVLASDVRAAESADLR